MLIESKSEGGWSDGGSSPRDFEFQPSLVDQLGVACIAKRKKGEYNVGWQNGHERSKRPTNRKGEKDKRDLAEGLGDKGERRSRGKVRTVGRKGCEMKGECESETEGDRV